MRQTPRVTMPPESFFAGFRERDREPARRFYQKHVDLKGLHIAAAGVVDDAALQRTHFLVSHLLAGRPDILETMATFGTRLIVIGKDQVYTDMPEYRNAPNPAYLNERVRGTGGLDVTSFGEENLLNLPLDRYDDESIAVHEFCHTIDAALSRLDPMWRGRLSGVYKAALAKGLWKNTYAASNAGEYWGEIAQSYFNCNRINNWNHGPIGTRELLQKYDPEGFALVRDTFKLTGVKDSKDWRYTPVRRQPSVIAPPEKYKFAPVFTKFTLAREFPVVGVAKTGDKALLKANDTIRKLFTYRHDILKALINEGYYLAVLPKGAAALSGADPKRLEVSEDRLVSLVGTLARVFYLATATRPADPEFEKQRDRQQYELRVKRLDVTLDNRLRVLFGEARLEKWVSGVEAYFDVHQPRSREQLQRTDPALFSIVEEVMAYTNHPDWRYRP
jgi:alpha-glucosidase